MQKYSVKNNDKILLCKGTECIHRFRCYRHSLYQDAIFKGFSFHEVDIDKCMNVADEQEEAEVLGFNMMWLPSNIPSN